MRITKKINISKDEIKQLVERKHLVKIGFMKLDNDGLEGEIE